MSCAVVFDNPVHQNGGCVFADPTVSLPAETETSKTRPYDGWHGVNYDTIRQDDEEILLIAAAFMEIIG
jgi:hypothetical protein